MVRTFLPQPAQADAQVLLAKRMFIAGCFGLPWLWAVNVMYFWDKTYGTRARGGGARGGGVGIVGSSSGSSTSSSTSSRRSSAELKKWVGRSLVGSIVGFAVFAVWILVFQLRWRHWGSAVLPFMINTPESYSTGW